MYELLTYSFKTGVCLAVFYLFFKLLLSRDTLHRFNRIVVLAAVALSFVLPLCVITVVRELPALPEAAGGMQFELPAEPDPEPESFPWEQLAVGMFLAGVAVTLGRTLWSLGSVLRLIRRGRCERLEDGTVLVRMDEAVTPFSWGRYIVISERDYAQSGTEILIHERAHLRLRHSWDLLLTDLAGCLQWFNPAMWLLRRELRAIHEYEADEAVLRSGVDAKHYQLMLIKKAAGGRWYSVANSFNHSKLKNRITMMLQKRSSRWAGAKALMLLPLAGVALGAFAQTAYVVPEGKVMKESVTVQIDGGNRSVDGVAGNPLVLVDGKPVTADSLPSGRIASVRVVEGDAATVGTEGQGEARVIRVSLRNEGGETDTKVEKVVVHRSETTKTGENSERIDLGTKGKVFHIRGRNADASDKSPVYVLDGRVASEEQINALQPGQIATMNVDKTGTVGVIFITTKTSLEAVKQNAQVALEGVAGARDGLKAGEEGIEAARAAVKKARKHMSKKEWKATLKQLDDAQKQIAQAREEMASAKVEIADELLKIGDGKQITVSYNETSAQPGVSVNVTRPEAGKEASVTVSSNDVGSEMVLSAMNDRMLVYIDGRKADRAALAELGHEKVRRMNIFKGAVAVEKYGEEARNGVIEVTTRK